MIGKCAVHPDKLAMACPRCFAESPPPDGDLRAALVEAARSMVGKARFSYRGRTRTAVDCSGLLHVSARAVGLVSRGPAEYPRDFVGGPFEEACARATPRLARPELALPGDSAVIATRGGIADHLVLLNERGGIIHSTAREPRCVVEHVLDEWWVERILWCGRFSEFA